MGSRGSPFLFGAAVLQDSRFTFLLAYRSRGVFTLLGATGLMLAFSWIGFQFSGRQPQTVALDMGLSFIRFVVPVLGVLLVQELVAKDIERRLIFTSLTYPRSRTSFLMGRFLAILVLVSGALFLMTTVLALWISLLGRVYDQSTPVDVGGLLFLVTAFNAVDFMVVLSFALVLATLSTVPNLVLLVSIGFMIVARSWSGIIRMLYDDDTIMQSAEQYREGLSGLRYVLPDLGSLDVRMLALYAKMEFLQPEAGWFVLMAFAYAAILLAMACWSFERRQFA